MPAIDLIASDKKFLFKKRRKLLENLLGSRHHLIVLIHEYLFLITVMRNNWVFFDALEIYFSFNSILIVWHNLYTKNWIEIKNKFIIFKWLVSHHCILFLRYQRKNKDSSLNPMAKANKIPIASHLYKSKRRLLINESLNST